MHATKLTTPNGEELIILPANEYQRLIDIAEDTIDSLSAKKIKHQLTIGEEEQIPAAFVERFIAGENPICVWREFRNMTQTTLAEESGIDINDLDEIEVNKKQGTVQELKAIATALRVSIDDLVV